jgi:hypothetical protein
MGRRQTQKPNGAVLFVWLAHCYGTG